MASMLQNSGITNISEISSTVSKAINIVSYNMHGYNQGSVAIRDIMVSLSPDVILLQEHWLTPSNFRSIFGRLS